MVADVDVRYLIKRLDMERPYSPTYGDVRDQSPFGKEYKGLHIRIKPHLDERKEYTVEVRGSLAKFANGGRHNRDTKNPYEMLYVLDELATDLRINLFETALNNLEVSATIPTDHAGRLIKNVASYLGKGPKRLLTPDGFPYADMQTSNHRLKLYQTTNKLLRVEAHADKMAYLGGNRPHTLADLAGAGWAGLMANKLLDAYDKIHWNDTDIDPDSLPRDEGYLLAKGRDPAYWQVKRNDMTKREYDRLRKNRERERPIYDAIVMRSWQNETPAEIRFKLEQQLIRYAEIMHTKEYEHAWQICWERWAIVTNLPVWATLPALPKLGALSHFYPLYIGNSATTQPTANASSKYPTVRDLRENPEQTSLIMIGHEPRRSHSDQPAETVEDAARHRLRNDASNEPNNTIRRLQNALNPPGGLLYPLDAVADGLSARGRAALAYHKKSLAELRISPARPSHLAVTLPLFPDYTIDSVRASDGFTQ